MKLTEKSVAALLVAFRSADPTPGGGSASALAGALGASLLAMIAGLPKPRAASELEVGRLRSAGRRSTELAERLMALVDRDSEAYDLVVGAYRLPKRTDEETTVRTGRIQEALRAAIEAPLDVMRACRDAAEQAATIVEFGNRNASSDAQVGLELLGAGLRGAKLNVEINLRNVKDAAYAESVRAQVQQLASEIERHTAAARAALAP